VAGINDPGGLNQTGAVYTTAKWSGLETEKLKRGRGKARGTPLEGPEQSRVAREEAQNRASRCAGTVAEKLLTDITSEKGGRG